MTDEEIIELLFARSEQGIEELDKKYGTLCHGIARNIIGNEQDAEECVNDAYLGVWNEIPPKKPKPLATFLCRILRNIAVNRYYLNTAQKRDCFYTESMEELEGVLATYESPHGKLEQREISRMIESFLDTLSPENRAIFMRRYWFSQTYAEIAKGLKISEKNVSVRLSRIREKMKKYLNEREIAV